LHAISPWAAVKTKAILFAGTIFPAAVFQRLGAYLEAMTLFTILPIPSGLAWIASGAALTLKSLPSWPLAQIPRLTFCAQFACRNHASCR
jgi:hypothetical protein